MFAVVRGWCEERGREFRIVTEQQVRGSFRLQNVKLLTCYARQKVDVGIRSQIRAFLQATPMPASISLRQIPFEGQSHYI